MAGYAPDLSASVVDNVFGCLISGRQVTTEFRLSMTANPDTGEPVYTYLLDIPAPAEVNEVALFLLPGNDFPPDQGVAIYSALPSSPEEFAFLGSLSSRKPTPILRTGWSSSAAMAGQPMATLALVMVPIDTIDNMDGAMSQTEWDKLGFVQLVARDLFNYLQSFAQMTPEGERIVLPTDAVDRWMARFESKFRHDPNFLLKTAGVASE